MAEWQWGKKLRVATGGAYWHERVEDYQSQLHFRHSFSTSISPLGYVAYGPVSYRLRYSEALGTAFFKDPNHYHK